jgi:CelD/BcsL family acetyltransferase involved in cellulose biosynthesis
VTAEVLADEAGVAAVAAAWRAMAVRVGAPYCLPEWMLAWFRHVAPPGSCLRVVAVRDGARLIGLAPYFVQPERTALWSQRLLGSGTSHRLAPLAEQGREQDVAAAAAAALAATRPGPGLITLEGASENSPWPRLLADAWPVRFGAAIHTGTILSAPTVSLPGGGYEDWLARKSRNFRQQLRRDQRRLAQAGGRVRRSGPAEVADDLETMFRLHHQRWEGRGTSGLTPPVQRMVAEAAVALGAEHVRLHVAEVDGRVIGAALFLAAGTEFALWNGGWDDEARDLRPGLQLLAAAIEEGIACGDRRLDLGGGPAHYKLRFADGDDPVCWRVLFPRDRRYPLTRAQMAPKHIREGVRRRASRLSPERKAALKRALGRVRPRAPGS